MLNYSKIFDKKALSYKSYRTLVDSLLLENKTTGEFNSEEYLHYTKMNVQRMSRLDKTFVVDSKLKKIVEELSQDLKVLIITEGWCGDAAQIVPIINSLAEAVPSKLNLKFVLRDQNLELTDQYLTNGGRAIPIVLILDSTGENVLAKWGPRPIILQDLLAKWKQENTNFKVIATQLHSWYAKDKGLEIQNELKNLFVGLK